MKWNLLLYLAMMLCFLSTIKDSPGIEAQLSVDFIDNFVVFAITGLITICHAQKKYATNPDLLIPICGKANHCSLFFLQYCIIPFQSILSSSVISSAC
jgi:hypothetical protein